MKQIELIGGAFDGQKVPMKPYEYGDHIWFIKNGVLHIYEYRDGKFKHVPKLVCKA